MPTLQKNSNSGPSALYALDTHRTRPGDILLTRVPMSFDDQATWASHVIQKVTKSPYSHAALCIEPGIFIEAIGTGIGRLVPVQACARATENIRLLRPDKEEVPQLAAVLRQATAAGQRYLQQGFARRAAPSGKVSAFQDPRRAAVFCAQLIARAYEDASLALLPGKKSEEVVPGDFLQSPYLQDVTAESVQKLKRHHEPHYYLDDMSLFERAHHWEVVTKLKILCNYDVRRILDGFNERPASFWELEQILVERKLRPLDEALYRGLTWYRYAEVYLQKLAAADELWTKNTAAHKSTDEPFDEILSAAAVAVKEQESDRECRAHEYRVYAENCGKYAGKTFTYLAEFHSRLLEASTRTLEMRRQHLHRLSEDMPQRGITRKVPGLFQPLPETQRTGAFA
jgi:hypothetical protein